MPLDPELTAFGNKDYLKMFPKEVQIDLGVGCIADTYGNYVPEADIPLSDVQPLIEYAICPECGSYACLPNYRPAEDSVEKVGYDCTVCGCDFDWLAPEDDNDPAFSTTGIPWGGAPMGYDFALKDKDGNTTFWQVKGYFDDK